LIGEEKPEDEKERRLMPRRWRAGAREPEEMMAREVVVGLLPLAEPPKAGAHHASC
jgi:hypothetical protein